MTSDPESPGPPGSPEGREGIAAGALTLSVATLLAKLLGVGRDLIIAAIYGASVAVDAFYLALAAPSLLASSVGMALGTATVPVASTVGAGEDEAGRRRFLGSLFQMGFLVALAIGGLIVVLAPLMPVPGSEGVSDGGFTLMVASAYRWLAVAAAAQILFFTVTGLFHAQRRFGPPPVCEIFGMVAVVISIPLLHAMAQRDALPIAWTVGAATMVGALSVWFAVVTRYRPGRPVFTPEIRRVAVLALPIMIAGAIRIASPASDRFLVGGEPEGSITAVSFAFMLLNVPIFLLVLPASQAALPALSDLAATGEGRKAHEAVGKMGRFLIASTIPISVFCVLEAVPLVEFVFRRGEFDEADVALTASAVAGYSVGLVPLAFVHLLSRVFFSYQRTSEVVISLVAGLGVKLCLSFVFLDWMGSGGLALATSAGFTVSAALMIVLLRCVPGRLERAVSLRSTLTSVGSAGAAAGAVLGIEAAWVASPFVVRGILFVGLYLLIYLGTAPRERREWMEAVASLGLKSQRRAAK